MEQCPDQATWAKRPDYVRREVTCPTRESKRCMCAVMAGSPWDGFRLFGPFATSDEAEEYQSKHLYGEDFWWIVDLKREV